MVDVSGKAETAREAVARGRVRMAPATLRLLRSGRTPKGDVLATAHLAAVLAAKRADEWIPLAHPLRVEAVLVQFAFRSRPAAVEIECRVRTTGRTGVEMEALTAVAAAGLTLVDMLKAVDRGLVIGDIAVWEKRGGRSGEWRRGDGTRVQGTARKVAPGSRSGRPGAARTRAASSRRPARGPRRATRRAPGSRAPARRRSTRPPRGR
jgi:cyclic pyranopterin phosphate synthase